MYQKRSEGKDVGVNLRFQVEIDDSSVEVIVNVSHLEEDSFEKEEINLDNVKSYIKQRVGNQAKRIVLEPLSEPPHWQILRFVDETGRTIELSDGNDKNT